MIRHARDTSGRLDQVADPEPDEPGVGRVAPDAGHEPAHDEELPDDVRLAEAVAREGRVGEVREILDDLEPEPDERAVDEAVDRRVDLRGGDQHEQQEPQGLEGLLVDRAGDRRPPAVGE